MGNLFGSKSSTPQSSAVLSQSSLESPPLSALLSQPWRKSPNLNTKYLSELKTRVVNFHLPTCLYATRANILLLGPARSGKSSFVKTITSIFQERITYTSTGGHAEHVTPKYSRFFVRTLNNETPLNFCLCDTRGFDVDGLPVFEDIIYLLEGNIQSGYVFTEETIQRDHKDFIMEPTLQDTIHHVVFVFDARSLKIIDDCIWKKISQLQIKMYKKDIPRTVLLTNIDRLSEVLKGDVSQVFLSKDVRNAVQYISHRLGIPAGNVMPIKNYEKETNESELNVYASCLALQALNKMLSDAKCFLTNQNDHIQNITA